MYKRRGDNFNVEKSATVSWSRPTRLMIFYAAVLVTRNGMLLLEYSAVQALHNVDFVELSSEMSCSTLSGPTLADAVIV